MIYRVEISQVHDDRGLVTKVVDFENLKEAKEFREYQREQKDVFVRLEKINGKKLSDFNKFKKDWQVGEYGYGYTLDEGLESNTLYLEQWNFLRKLLDDRLTKKIADDNLQESDIEEIETLERVCATISIDFGDYTEEFNERFYQPYFNKFGRTN
mgnify:FL=1|jgi:hypothetical protein|tara:strand:- start:55 stop:519 length:465 start_codon:yes stop_codon:yes gene_type:complete